MQVDDSWAPGVTQESDDAAFAERLAWCKSRCGPLEVTEQHQVVTLLTSLPQYMMSDDGVAEQRSDVQHPGVAHLVLELNQVHLGAAGRNNVDSAVSHCGKVGPSTLHRVREV